MTGNDLLWWAGLWGMLAALFLAAPLAAQRTDPGVKPVSAEDPADPAPGEKTAGEKLPDAKGLDEKLLDDLDRDLLQDLDAPRTIPQRPASGGSAPGGTADGEAPSEDGAEDGAEDRMGAGDQPAPVDDPLQAIGRRMRSVEQRIAEYDTSGATQNLQQDIVADLDALIEQMKKQCASSSSQKSPGSGRAGRTGGQGSQAADQAASRPARDSTDRLGTATSDKVDGQEVEDVVKQIWGHLPPKVRELMRSASVEEFLPKYEQQIEAYYRRLAEEE